MSDVIKKVMISSTVIDLPRHRKEVRDACLQQDMFPLMMEFLPAASEDARTISLQKVDEADIYLGIFANRYGYIPRGYRTSITEMEFRRAVERDIPVMIFIMHRDHPVKVKEIETGDGAEKIKRLKEELERKHVVNYFKSPEELWSMVINSLSKY